MENEFAEKLLNVLINISESIKSIPFWEDYSFWLSAVATVALVFTLAFLIKYTRATEKMAHATESMARYQLIPAIDVNMVYDKNLTNTYFWFSNESNLPGIVHLEYQKNKEGRKIVYKPLRIPPRRSMKTATTFDFSPTEGDEMIIYVLIRPAIYESNFEIKFEKSYIFAQDRYQWDESSWSFPDPPFPG